VFSVEVCLAGADWPTIGLDRHGLARLRGRYSRWDWIGGGGQRAAAEIRANWQAEMACSYPTRPLVTLVTLVCVVRTCRTTLYCGVLCRCIETFHTLFWKATRIGRLVGAQEQQGQVARDCVEVPNQTACDSSVISSYAQHPASRTPSHALDAIDAASPSTPSVQEPFEMQRRCHSDSWPRQSWEVPDRLPFDVSLSHRSDRGVSLPHGAAARSGQARTAALANEINPDAISSEPTATQGVLGSARGKYMDRCANTLLKHNLRSFFFGTKLRD